MNRRTMQRKSGERSDMYYTPPEAIEPVIPLLSTFKKIWDPASGKGHITQILQKHGHDVLETDVSMASEHDFLVYKQTTPYDCIVCNPPFSLKRPFLERCFELKKPFMMLVPLNMLETVGGREILKTNEFSIVFPRRNINYINAKDPDRKSVAFFYSVWVTHQIPDVQPYHFISA